MSAGPSSARMVIDLTESSSDEEERRSGSAVPCADESIEFISATRRHFDPSIPNAAASLPSSLIRPQSLLDLRHDSSLESTVRESALEAPDSDIGDETRQLLAEMEDDDDSNSMSSLDEDAPLASLSLLSPAKRSPPKRPRGRPRKLASAGGGGDDEHGDGDDDEDSNEERDEYDENDDDDEEHEAEPDSLFLSSALSHVLAESVKADAQLWLRILRFEPIPIEELASCATRSAAAHTKEASSRSGKAIATSYASSSSLRPDTVNQDTAWKEWNVLLTGSQKRLELAIQSWADEQGICSFAEEGRNEKRNARKATRSRKAATAADHEDDDQHGSGGESSPS
ncbi:hypothetical protein CF328_g9371, partial [Tilletia controversa]